MAAIAKKNDYTDLWNQAYPGEVSNAETSTMAKTQQDVDNMTIRDRLFDSMQLGYGVQRRESDRSYDQAQSQFNNQQLARGMQRSSYGAATSANLANKKIEAQNQIYGSQIADYENRLQQVEQQEEATRQFNAQMGNNWLNQIIAKGGKPSDELLAQVGLSRADYNAMVQQLSGGGGGGGGATTTSRRTGTKKITPPPPTTPEDGKTSFEGETGIGGDPSLGQLVQGTKTQNMINDLLSGKSSSTKSNSVQYVGDPRNGIIQTKDSKGRTIITHR